jgi:hypothetical protein
VVSGYISPRRPVKMINKSVLITDSSRLNLNSGTELHKQTADMTKVLLTGECGLELYIAHVADLYQVAPASLPVS